MPTFERGDIVRVPFPYTDRPTLQRRPAIVVSAGPVGDRGRLLWVAMITSATHRPWPGDIAFGEAYRAAGLPSPSIVRPCKIATIEAADADKIGTAEPAFRDAVSAAVALLLGRP